MALYWQSLVKKIFSIAVFFCILITISASEDVEKWTPPATEVVASNFVSSDFWFFNGSLNALVETIHPSTVLVAFDDGSVQAWRESSDAMLWSLSSGPPLVSFHWFPRESCPDEEDEGEWHVEGTGVSIGDDGSLSVGYGLNRTKTLKLTLEDLRQGLVHVTSGEIIQVNRHTTVFLVDLETGAIVQELGNGNSQDWNFEEEKKSLFLIRTDYIAKASNLSGTSLWTLSYGEIGTLVTGLQPPPRNMASLSLIPKRPVSSPPVHYKIAPPMRQAMLGYSGPETEYPKAAQNHPHDPLALPEFPAPPSLPPPRPALALWEQHTHAPGMQGSPKPTPWIIAIYTTVAGFMVLAIFSLVLKISYANKALPTPPKKKKGRKVSPSGKEMLTVTAQESDSLTNGARLNLQLKYGSGTQVGRLFVSNNLIGSGSNGTLVLEGYLDDRKVAVKRLLAQYYEKAQKEIALLIASDEHPNVVRYYATEETADFVYVSLERCSFNLYDLILAQTSQGSGMERQVKECLIGKGLKLRSMEDFKLWDERGRPSMQLFQVMRDMVAGLAHLHAVGIVHRDLKPHNVLISSGRIMQAKIADMGLSKQLDDDAVSFDTQLTGHGSSGSRGWQAPEQLLRGRGSRAVDIFSLGCVLYHCITGGKHPFGSHLERDGNIVYGKMDLFHIVDYPAATDLIERLLDPIPAKRTPAQDILAHPFFWDSEKRLSFLKDASDRVELDIKDCNSVLLGDLESLELSVLCGGWDGKVDFPLLQNIRGYRRYNFKSVRDLLRVIRNKANHFRELPEDLQTVLGPFPEGLEDYFSSRFPRLLIDIYQVIGFHCKTDASFEKYYSGSYVPKFPLSDTK